MIQHTDSENCNQKNISACFITMLCVISLNIFTENSKALKIPDVDEVMCCVDKDLAGITGC